MLTYSNFNVLRIDFSLGQQNPGYMKTWKGISSIAIFGTIPSPLDSLPIFSIDLIRQKMQMYADAMLQQCNDPDTRYRAQLQLGLWATHSSELGNIHSKNISWGCR